MLDLKHRVGLIISIVYINYYIHQCKFLSTNLNLVKLFMWVIEFVYTFHFKNIKIIKLYTFYKIRGMLKI